MADEPTLEALQAQLAAREARIKELNAESVGHRFNAAEERKKREDAEKALDTARTEFEGRVKQIETETGEKLTKAQQTAVKANLRAAAKDAGANDPSDLLAFIPADKLKISDDGEIENAEALIADLKKTKPYLFGTPSTSSTAKKPDEQQTKPKHARDMTDAERAAALAALTRG